MKFWAKYRLGLHFSRLLASYETQIVDCFSEDTVTDNVIMQKGNASHGTIIIIDLKSGLCLRIM